MWFVPFESFSITSGSTRETVIKQIEENINPPMKFSFKNILTRPNCEKYFNGSYNSNRFKLIRAIKQGRNSFRPVIKCKVTNYGDGCKINVKMYLHPIVIIFLLWIVILSMGLIKLVTSDQKFNPDSNGCIFLIVIYCIFTCMFKYEARKDKDMLQIIVD